MTSYPTPAFRRTALAPAILGAIVLLAGTALLGTSGYTWILFGVAILALITCVFAYQAKQWWWLILLVPVAVVWNPIVPLPMEPPQLFMGLQYVAAIIFIAAGVLIKVRNPEDRNRR
ncbi:MAG: hypothetical protein JWQ43_2957 [Glaciihabitans sp.]|nr:hypothetical protein [Glaciihabitans sp.]